VADSAGSAWSGTLRTIFLDRDGVLNEKMPEGSYVRAWSDFRVLPGVPEAVARLNRAGIRVIVVSNQRGIALGLYSEAEVAAIHANLQDVLKARGAHVDAFYICPHDKQHCNCRKPLPGMFEQAQRDFPDIKASTGAMIGDSLSDIEFGARLGMRTVFIEGDAERQKAGAEAAAELADARFASLAEAVEALLQKA
jgi:D-glycero-D-manno-heptose 1,7-bisphosphate phosphatase